MTKDRGAVEGDILPPERSVPSLRSQQSLPYASPAEMLDRVGGFIQRWQMRGRMAGANDIAQQFERLYSSYVNLYNLMASLEHSRIEHGRAINELQHLDDILREDNRRRTVAAQLAAKRDELTLLELDRQLAAARQDAADDERRRDRRSADAVPASPAEELRKAADLRQALRRAVEELTAQIVRDAGGRLTKEARAEIQRIKDDAERLILHGGIER